MNRDKPLQGGKKILCDEECLQDFPPQLRDQVKKAYQTALPK